MSKKYWFKPKRIGKWVAAYYPVTSGAWAVTLILIMFLVKIFMLVDAHSHSNSDTIIGGTPWAIAIFMIYDLLCFRLGQYPAWWRRAERS
jgi:hypothetical protein